MLFHLYIHVSYDVVWCLLILQEESDQRRALDKVQQIRDGKIRREPQRIESPKGKWIN